MRLLYGTCSDPVHRRAGLRHRSGAHLPLLLPVAQGQGDRGLLRRHHGRPPGLAHHGHDHRAVRVRGPLQRILPRGDKLPAEDTRHRHDSQHAIH